MKNCNYHIWYLTSRPASSIQVNPADWITWGQDMNFGEETLQRLFLRNILRRFSNYWSERRNRHWHVNKLRVNSYHLLGGLTWSLYFIRNWGQIVTFLGESYHFVGLTSSLYFIASGSGQRPQYDAPLTYLLIWGTSPYGRGHETLRIW